MRRLALVAILAAASTAHADKSPDVATALSGVGTGVSSAAILASFFLGSGTAEVNMPVFFAGLGSAVITPSLGQIYSREYLTYGMAVRAGAGVLAAIAVTTQQETVACDDGINKDCKSLKGAGFALLGVAAIGFIGGMAYDVMDASDAAVRANHAAIFSVSVVPTVVPHGGGLGLVGSF